MNTTFKAKCKFHNYENINCALLGCDAVQSGTSLQQCRAGTLYLDLPWGWNQRLSQCRTIYVITLCHYLELHNLKMQQCRKLIKMYLNLAVHVVVLRSTYSDLPESRSLNGWSLFSCVLFFINLYYIFCSPRTLRIQEACIQTTQNYLPHSGG